jgi:hypothetical protein
MGPVAGFFFFFFFFFFNINEPSHTVEGRKFLSYLRNCELLKKDSSAFG